MEEGFTHGVATKLEFAAQNMPTTILFCLQQHEKERNNMLHGNETARLQIYQSFHVEGSQKIADKPVF